MFALFGSTDGFEELRDLFSAPSRLERGRQGVEHAVYMLPGLLSFASIYSAAFLLNAIARGVLAQCARHSLSENDRFVLLLIVQDIYSTLRMC